MLCDRLEEKMKGTVVDGTLKALFGGTMRPTTRCLPPVDYVSSREEEYYDIQLNVKGCVGWGVLDVCVCVCVDRSGLGGACVGRQTVCVSIQLDRSTPQ